MMSHSYPTLILVHNALRWAVLLSGIVLVVGSFVGKGRGFPYKPAGAGLTAAYTSLLSLQFVVGLFLSCVSPLVRTFWSNPAAGMKSHDLRFFAIEHTILMIAALALAHIGSARARRASTDEKAFSTSLTWAGASMALIIAGIPWWRPLLG